jgi:hypothetical protein
MAAEQAKELGYHWPAPPAPDSIEWSGTPIGVSNVVTRTKSRTSVHDKALDRDPTHRDALIDRARSYAETQAGRVCIHDVVIHGVRVRAITNMPHLYDFWNDNWFGADEWRQVTGKPAPEEPAVVVYALGYVPEDVGAYYSREKSTIVFFNTSYYGQLKSWVLGAVGRILADEFGIHSIHGAAVDIGGEGTLFIAPTGTGKSTASYGLMRLPGSAFHSDDWVYVRYAIPLRDGTQVSPVSLRAPDGSLVRGYRVLPWLASHDAPAGATLDVLTLNNGRRTVAIDEVDVEAPPAAYAYISERWFYLRSNIVESFPAALPSLMQSKLENCPDVTAEFMDRRRQLLNRAVGELDGRLHVSHEELAHDLARLMAFDNARAMLDISRVFGEERVYGNPLTPLRLTSVFLLRRDADDDRVLRRLSEAQFIADLVAGRTPMGVMETAYNAYRAVDDKAERAFIDGLLNEVGYGASPGAEERVLKGLFSTEQTLDSLREEFTLFRQLYRSAACLEMNTILRQDPSVLTTREAVNLTLDLLIRVTDHMPESIDLHLSDYRSYLQGS